MTKSFFYDHLLIWILAHSIPILAMTHLNSMKLIIKSYTRQNKTISKYVNMDICQNLFLRPLNNMVTNKFNSDKLCSY